MKGNNLALMAEKSEYRMVFSLSSPVILSLLVQGLYNLVDSIFLSRLGEDVLSAVSLAFVFQSLCTSFFSGIATGINALVSRALGAERKDSAQNYVASGFAIQGLLCIAVMFIGIFGVRFYFSLSTSNVNVITNGVEYLQPLLCFSIFSCSQITFERLLQAVGMAKYMFCSQLLGTIINFILDPILIFGLLGFPKLGVLGASIATLIGQACAAGLAVYFNVLKNKIIFDAFKFKIKKRFIKDICWIGLPTSSVGIAGAIGNYYMNIVLIDYMSTANAAFGIYTKLQEVALMPTQGFGAGLVTQLSFFYGRRNMYKIRRSLIAGTVLIEIWSLICFCCFFFLPELLMMPFSPTEQMLRIGIPCFKIIGTTYIVSGAMIALNSFFQSIGKSIFSIAISVSRQILVRIPVAAFLAQFGNINLIWICWPVSEIASDAVSLTFFIYAYKKLKKRIAGEVNE